MPNLVISRRDAARLARLLEVLGPDWSYLAEKFTEASKTRDQREQEILAWPISELELSVRTTNLLLFNRIETVSDFLSLTATQLWSWKGFGRKSIKEILEVQKNIRERIAV